MKLWIIQRRGSTADELISVISSNFRGPPPDHSNLTRLIRKILSRILLLTNSSIEQVSLRDTYRLSGVVDFFRRRTGIPVADFTSDLWNIFPSRATTSTNLSHWYPKSYRNENFPKRLIFFFFMDTSSSRSRKRLSIAWGELFHREENDWPRSVTVARLAGERRVPESVLTELDWHALQSF